MIPGLHNNLRMYKQNKVMKKLLVLTVFMSAFVSTFAQSDFRDREGEYKAFVDVGLSVSVADKESFTNASLTTSHGIQVNPAVFCGAGVGADVLHSSKSKKAQITVPIFVQLRYNFTENVISPYVDVKVGYMCVDKKGLFTEPSFGVSMPVKDHFAINFGIAYNFFRENVKDYVSYDSLIEVAQTNYHKQHNIVLKFGFEF